MNQPSEYLDASSAAALLGVKLATLYAYASRGLVRSTPGDGGRARRYLREDLERLRARHDARAGHAAVAASALRWGEPVLETRVTALSSERGPRYRGRDAVALARDGASFESVAELLWSGASPSPGAFRARSLGVPARRLAGLLPRAGARPADALSVLVPALGARDAGRFDRRVDAVAARARVLIARMAAALALADPATRDARLARALETEGVAARTARALGARPGADGERAIDRALVLCADHELNPSSFAARVAASAGADVYACVAAALATLSGPEHGGACDRVEALLAEASAGRGAPDARAEAVVRERGRRGDALPGFGHTLYPRGDPRAAPLLEAAEALAPRDAGVRTALALAAAMRETRGEHPTIDLGLVALAAALGLPPGGALCLFAIGRAAGWVAHVLEQYAAGYTLRPRALYVGDE